MKLLVLGEARFSGRWCLGSTPPSGRSGPLPPLPLLGDCPDSEVSGRRGTEVATPALRRSAGARLNGGRGGVGVGLRWLVVVGPSPVRTKRSPQQPSRSPRLPWHSSRWAPSDVDCSRLGGQRMDDACGAPPSDRGSFSRSLPRRQRMRLTSR